MMNSKKVYYIIRAIMGLAFHMMFTAAALYRIDVARLEVYQLILLGTALEIAIFLFETPTGVLADLKSRRLSVIIGMFIIGIGFALEGVTTIFMVIFASQVLWGLGYTFISGALDSWISDEVEGVEKVIITGAQYNKGFSFMGILMAAFIGFYDVRLALFVSGGIFIVLALFSVMFMHEKEFEKVHHDESILKSYYIHLTSGFKHIKTDKVLRVMFIVMLFYGLYSEGIDRTYELHILDGLGFRSLDIPSIWIIAFVNAVIALVGVVFLHWVKSRLTSAKHIIVWTVQFTVMMVIGILMFALLPSKYFALLGYLLFMASREGAYPLLNTILLKNTPSRIKATVLSSFGQLDAIGQMLSGALMVTVGVYFGVSGIYYFTAALLLVPIVLLPKAHK